MVQGRTHTGAYLDKGADPGIRFKGTIGFWRRYALS